MFVIYKCNNTDSPYKIHDGNTVTIEKQVSMVDQTYIVSRYTENGERVSWVAHLSELNGFNGE